MTPEQIAWYQRERSRIVNRAAMEAALPGDWALVASVRNDYWPLVDFTLQKQLPPEELYPDSKILINQNV